jgi:K+-transporting ATPase ATPase C chain
MPALIASLRVVIATMLLCVVGYTALILGFAHLVTPATANGSLLTDRDGRIVGSRLIAQKFEQPRYFWPRPSAAGAGGYDAAHAAGSNKSPTSRDLADRARRLIARHGASSVKPLPPELAAASGSGLDPHLTEHAALYQAERVAKARHVPLARIETLIKQHAIAPGGALTATRLVNVLELNLALDSIR